MTIAGLYLSPEGVVLGADSTSSADGPNGYHYFNFSQKVFEIGEDSTFGIVTWGRGGVGAVSYRTLIARLGDDLKAKSAVSVEDVASRWIDIFWPEYVTCPDVVAADILLSKQPWDESCPDLTANRSSVEEDKLSTFVKDSTVGFCIAGYALPQRVPDARIVTFTPGEARPVPARTNRHNVQWWGMQSFANRIVFGIDDEIIESVMSSGKWTGTESELIDLIGARPIMPEVSLPIRDAIDYVHALIYCTIKSMKFSSLAQVCGGPIELAVITADRKFRWVRHKPWHAAITDGEMQWQT